MAKYKITTKKLKYYVISVYDKFGFTKNKYVLETFEKLNKMYKFKSGKIKTELIKYTNDLKFMTLHNMPHSDFTALFGNKGV